MSDDDPTGSADLQSRSLGLESVSFPGLGITSGCLAVSRRADG